MSEISDTECAEEPIEIEARDDAPATSAFHSTIEAIINWRDRQGRRKSNCYRRRNFGSIT